MNVSELGTMKTIRRFSNTGPGQSTRLKRIGGKIYDFGTANRSFLQLARDLRTLGITNCYFMLELKDPGLVNINPYAKDEHGNCTLTNEQIDRILLECKLNPWYYLREVCRIPDQGGTAVPYRANRGNIAQAWCIWKGYDSWLCIPRQKGKTQSALAMEAWMYSFGTTNSDFIFVNKDGPNAKKNLERLRDQILLLPAYMQFPMFIDDDGTKVKHRMSATSAAHPVTNNKIIVKPQATSYDKALSLARGLTAPIIHFDEPEFTPHIKTIVENSVSTFEEAAKNARKNHAMYGRIFTCTPGDLDTAPGMEAQLILDRTRKWTEKIYDWTKEEIDSYLYPDQLLSVDNDDDVATLAMNRCNGIFYIEYQYYQIGLSQKWLVEIAGKIGDPLTVRREILLQRLHGSNLSPYPQEDIEYIVENQQKPIDELWIMDYFKFDIYEKLDRRIPYIVGVDCSTGTVGDNNAISVIHPFTLRPVAEFECNYVGETLYEQIIVELITKYIPKACLCIERNSVGDGIIDFFLETNSPVCNNLYYDRDRDLVDEKMRQSQDITSLLRTKATRKTYYGVYTHGTSREQMFAILSKRVSENKDDFVTNNITRDLSRLIRKPNLRIEAGPGFHDDSIMSYLIALYVYYHGNNLSLFGITRGAREEDLNNGGLRRPDEIDPTLVDPKLIEHAKKQEEQEEAMHRFEQDLIQAERDSQRNSLRLHHAGLLQQSVFGQTPDGVGDDYDLTGEIPLDLF